MTEKPPNESVKTFSQDYFRYIDRFFDYCNSLVLRNSRGNGNAAGGVKDSFYSFVASHNWPAVFGSDGNFVPLGIFPAREASVSFSGEKPFETPVHSAFSTL